QVRRQLVKLRAGQVDIQVQRAVGPLSDKGQVDIGLHQARKLDLGLFGSVSQALHRRAVLGEVDAVFLLKLRHQVIDDPLVEVVAAQVVVAAGGLDFKDAVAQLEDAHVKGAAAQVKDQDRLVLF